MARFVDQTFDQISNKILQSAVRLGRRSLCCSCLCWLPCPLVTSVSTMFACRLLDLVCGTYPLRCRGPSLVSRAMVDATTAMKVSKHHLRCQQPLHTPSAQGIFFLFFFVLRAFLLLFSERQAPRGACRAPSFSLSDVHCSNPFTSLRFLARFLARFLTRCLAPGF